MEDEQKINEAEREYQRLYEKMTDEQLMGEAYSFFGKKAEEVFPAIGINPYLGQADPAFVAALQLAEADSEFLPFEGDTLRVLQMPEEELQRHNAERERGRAKYVRERVNKHLENYGYKNAPRFIDAEGIGLGAVVKALGIRHLRQLENIGYTPFVWKGLGYHISFVDGGKIDRIYRKRENECVQCYPRE